MTGARGTVGMALAIAVAATACTTSAERERIDFERMRVQQRYEPYGASGVFANHESMQQPPAGTLTRESGQDTGVIGSGLNAGRDVAAVPIAVTPERLALGQAKFIVYCAVCHGAGAFGGSIVAENMGPRMRAPSLRSAAMIAQTAGYLFNVATHGKGRMPPYAAQLTIDERWAVVAYVKAMQHAPVATAAQRADSLRAVEIKMIDSARAAERRP